MIYIYAYKRLEETNNETADTILYSYNTTWNIAETISNMNESDFLQFIFNTSNVFGKVDKVRILEIIK